MGPVVFEEGAAVAGDVMAAAAAFPKLRLEGEALLSRKEELLEICRWMREWLHTEGGIHSIPMDFPVEEFAECVRVGGGSASGASSSVGTEVDPEAPRQVSHMSAVPGDEVLAYGVEPVLTCDPGNFLGVCRVENQDWECMPLATALRGDLNFCSKKCRDQTVLVARRWHCQEIRVRLTRRDNPNQLLDVQSVLMTFLHELAHASTPGVFVHSQDVKVIGRGGSLKPVKKKGKSDRVRREERRTFVFDCHSEVFYSQFACILRAAEKTGLLKFPIRSDKYSLKNLRRLDAWDLESCPLSRDYTSCVEDLKAQILSCDAPTSSLVEAPGVGEDGAGVSQEEGLVDVAADVKLRLREPLRVTFRHRSKGEKVTLLPPTDLVQGCTPLQSLFDSAIQKYGKRTVKRMLTLNGEPVDCNQAVLDLPQGSVLLVLESKGKGIPPKELLLRERRQ